MIDAPIPMSENRIKKLEKTVMIATTPNYWGDISLAKTKLMISCIIATLYLVVKFIKIAFRIIYLNNLPHNLLYLSKKLSQ